ARSEETSRAACNCRTSSLRRRRALHLRAQTGSRGKIQGKILEVCGSARLLRRFVYAAVDLCGKYKMRPQMRDVLKKENLVPQCDVVEEDHVLMDLAHVSHVRH